MCHAATKHRSGAGRACLPQTGTGLILVWFAVSVWPVAPAGAQIPASGRIILTVLDPSGALIPHASATLLVGNNADEASERTSTSPSGVVVIDNVSPGRYGVRVAAPGFTASVLENIRVSSTDVRRTVRLALEALVETVVVDRDRQSAALDPRGFSTVLTREQIDALPDDPEDFARALRDLAPPGAVIRIDGFTGGNMPPKSQILAIRIPRLDSFAAQDHGGLSSLSFIDIITRPGGGKLQGSTDVMFRDGALNARNPLAPERGPESTRLGTLALDGPIVPDLVSFALSIRAGRQEEATAIRAALPGGEVRAESVIRPQDGITLSGRVATALGRDHTLRLSFSSDRRTFRNLGVGDYNLRERAYHTASSDATLRAAGGGPLGRRGLIESRVQVRWTGVRSVSAVEAPSLRVLDAFTAGGAQVAGGSQSLEVQAAVDIDYSRGAHAWRTGALVESGRYHSNRQSNYLGTYTFASIEDYLLGRPTSYTRRMGSADVRYENAQVGIYVQDDFRVARSLLLSYGLRYEAQTLVDDPINLLPRGGLTWSPARNGTTTLRAGWGLFAEWLGTDTYEQSLVLDGRRQHDIHVLQPAFPDPGAIGDLAPRERYLVDETLRLAESGGVSVGVEQHITPAFRLYASYGYRAGWHLLRGRNLNAPVQGYRPDPTFGNVIQTRGDAGSRAHTVTMQAVRSRPQGRVELAAAYAFSRSVTNTTGPFGVPASGDNPAGEWGATGPLHVGTATLTTRVTEGLSVSLTPRWRAGAPYTITSGRDDNGDGLFTDRPIGVGRNSSRARPQFDVGARLSWMIRFGPVTRDPSGWSSAGADGQSARASSVAAAPGPGSPRRFRVEIFAAAQNVTNHPNYLGMSGVQGSPFFGKPTLAVNPRRIEVGARFGF